MACDPSEFADFGMSWAESYINHVAGQNIIYGCAESQPQKNSSQDNQ